MNTAREALGGVGIQTAALGFGGYVQWLEQQQNCGMEQVGHANPTGLATARYNIGGAGTQALALGFGGKLLQQQPKNGQE
jgi:hypothetical protein